MSPDGSFLESAEVSGAGPFALELAQVEPGPYLRRASSASQPAARDPLPDQILAWLGQSCQPRTAESIRSCLQVRNQRLVECLRQLCEQGKVVRLPQG